MIALARKAGLHLDEWQQYVLTHGLGQTLDGDWTSKKASCWVPRQNGKGGIIEALELAWLFLFEEELIVHSAHEHKTSKKAYARMERLIRRTPSMFRRVKTFRQANGESMVILRDGRQLEYHTRSNTAVRGFSAPKLVLDEAQELTEDHMAAIQPTVSAMPNWQMWFFGTPPRSDDAWVYGLREDGEANTPRLAHFDWGADLNPEVAADKATIANPETWYSCNPALGIRIQIETVEDELKPSGLGSKFGQERLGIWKPRKSGSGVLDLAQWARLGDLGSKRDSGIGIAVDISTLRDWASISVYGMRADALGHGQLVDYRGGTDWIVERLAELKVDLDPVGIGMGRGTYESLKQQLTAAGMHTPEDLAEVRGDTEPRRGDLLVTNAATMAAACGQLIDAVRQESLRYIPAAQLDESVAGARIRATGTTIAWSPKDSECDISPVTSLTLARYTFVTRVDAIQDAPIEPSAFFI